MSSCRWPDVGRRKLFAAIGAVRHRSAYLIGLSLSDVYIYGFNITTMSPTHLNMINL